jgi:hypothetical protein
MGECVLIELIALPAEQSRGRSNPRVVKRKMSGFPTKARAAPAVPGRIIAADHIRIVAPPPDPVLLPAVVPLAAGPKASATPAPAPKLETIWRAHIRSWQTSGLSRSAYCQRHGLALRSFNTWVARLRNTRRHPRKAIHEDTDEAVQT